MTRGNFNPRSPYGERPVINVDFNGNRLFQSTLPLRGATPAEPVETVPPTISIHAPLTGSDRYKNKDCWGGMIFQSTLPLRGATKLIRIKILPSQFQSTLPLRGATRQLAQKSPPTKFQSTLPLRGATGIIRDMAQEEIISIHAPLTGSDFRGQTSFTNGKDFNPRSPYGERHGDKEKGTCPPKFQSTLPLRGATYVNGEKRALTDISIHAPLTGSDCGAKFEKTTTKNFNPRSPYGERQ